MLLAASGYRLPQDLNAVKEGGMEHSEIIVIGGGTAGCAAALAAARGGRKTMLDRAVRVCGRVGDGGAGQSVH